MTIPQIIENKKSLLGIIITFLFIHIVFYVICFIGIFKRKTYAVITLRSPKLLLTHNIAGLCTSLLFYIKLIIDDSVLGNSSEISNLKKHYYYIPSLFYIFQITMVASFSLSCHRIIYSTNVNEEETKTSSKKKQRYKEKFYIRFIVILFIILGVFIIVLDIKLKDPFTMNLLERSFDSGKIVDYFHYTVQANVWLIINLIENLVLLTYAFFIWQRDIHLKLKLEAMIFFTLCFVYSIMISTYELFLYKWITQNTMVIISLIYLLLCLLLNGYFPLLLSFYSGNEVGYIFSSNLANDLYLFLSNENCYGAFYGFVVDDNDSSLYLKIYTQIMVIKLNEVNVQESQIIIKLANEVLKTIKESNSNDEQYNSVINEVKNKLGDKIDGSNYKTDMFDVLLKFVFGKLNTVFNEFKKEKEFKILIEGINTNSKVKGNIIDKGLGGKY